MFGIWKGRKSLDHHRGGKVLGYPARGGDGEGIPARPGFPLGKHYSEKSSTRFIGPTVTVILLLPNTPLR